MFGTGGTSVSASDFTGRVTGNAGVSFSAAGAAITVTLNVANAGSSGTGNFAALVHPTVPSTFAGNSGGPVFIGPGATVTAVTLGTSGSSYDVMGGYVVKLDSGATYTGVYRFRCA